VTPLREALLLLGRELPILHEGAPAPSHVAADRKALLMVIDTMTAHIDRIDPLPTEREEYDRLVPSFRDAASSSLDTTREIIERVKAGRPLMFLCKRDATLPDCPDCSDPLRRPGNPTYIPTLDLVVFNPDDKLTRHYRCHRAKFDGEDDMSCGGCGCKPGEGRTPGCTHPEGCGYRG
jgi:hypothetical protein